MNHCVFAVCVSDGIQKMEYTSREFTLISSGGAREEWGGDFDGARLTVSIEFIQNQGENISRATVNHSGRGAVEAFFYPYVHFEDVPAYDNLLFASAWGDNLPRPTKVIRDVSSSTSIRFAQDYIRYAPNEVIYTYPSIMAMQYMVLYNPCHSHYIAAYSESGNTMTFHAQTDGRYGLRLKIGHYPFLSEGGFSTPLCSVAALGGGWHEAARLYASHMNKVFPSPDSPSWMKGSYHGWVEKFVKYSHRPPNILFSDLPDFYQRIHEKTGMDHLFLVGWHDNGHDTMFPSFLPCEEAGGEQALKDAIAAIHSMGGKVSLYTNARLIDIQGDFYQNGGGREAICLDKNGRPYLESYGSGDVFAVSCPGSGFYVDQMTQVTQRIAGEYLADGMFEDQISCNLAHFCYDKNHTHKNPAGNYLPGVTKELKAMRAAHQRINPDFHTFSEGCHERFNMYYDVNQGHGEEYTWQIGESKPEVFSYTYPLRTVTGHCADMAQLFHSMAQMKPLDLKESCYADEATHMLIKKYIALRQEYARFFCEGIFIDDEGFSCAAGRRIFAKKADNGDICAAIWAAGGNVGEKQQAILLLPSDEYAPTHILYADEAGIISFAGKTASIVWEGPLCFVILRFRASG